MHIPSRKKSNIMQTKVSLFARCLFFCFFHVIACFCGVIFNSKHRLYQRRWACVCFRRQAGDRREKGNLHGERTEAKENKKRQRQKMRPKKRAITYLCESGHMSMEESNDSNVLHSKCFPNYQAVASTINMMFFVGFRFPNILCHCVFIRISFFHLRLRL